MTENPSNLVRSPSCRDTIPERFPYIYSCDLDVEVSIKICSLEGLRPKRSFQELLNDPDLKFCDSGEVEEQLDSHMFTTVQLYEDGVPICLPVQTAYKHHVATPGRSLHSWNEWLKLPLRYSDLPRHTQAVITIWDAHGPGKKIPVGGTCVRLFGKYGTFKNGRHDLCIWPDRTGDGNVPTSTPHKTPSNGNQQMTRLAKLAKKHREGHMTKVDWLDRLTFREIEVINEQEKRKQNFMYLMVEFSRVFYKETDFTIVYFEKDGDEPVQVRTNPYLVVIPDHELMVINLVEEKHHKLVRSLRVGQHDLKPNAVVRDQLTNIMTYPISRQLTEEEEDLIWKFRYYLMQNKRALTKFLRCVKWEREQESLVALQLLEKWSPIDVADALELLSPSFQNPTVRRYAVKILSQTTDENLLLYLLQLVQALKYENFDEIKEGLDKMMRMESQNALKSRSSSQSYEHDASSNHEIQSSLPRHGTENYLLKSTKQTSNNLDLATFLIERACKNSVLTNFFYWYVLIECEQLDNAGDKENKKVPEMYITVLRRFSTALLKGSRQCKLRRSQLSWQQKFLDKLVDLMKAVQKDSGNRKKKIEKLRAMLISDESTDLKDSINFASFDPLFLPLDPEVKVNGIICEKATLYKSNLMPAKLTFTTTAGGTYTTIFKHGDDLRQDQLVLQIITLMDKLLQKENLDLKLTPYKVLATSSKHGFVQHIESQSVAEILATEGSIQNFFRKHQPSESHQYGIDPDVMDTYIKSCAGYCVVTYILGVGDRHLDNLLLRKTGALFHIDFGYILGRDPKPLPPPMRLSKEMVEAMGGINSSHYQEFRKHCYTAFLHLRRQSNLILNLFSLMTDASVPDIALEPDKTVRKVQEKFLLELSDEEAVRNFQVLIDESVSALFAVMVEQIHKMAQYIRK